jgi:superoxide dismutase, Cu-Zn family
MGRCQAPLRARPKSDRAGSGSEQELRIVQRITRWTLVNRGVLTGMCEISFAGNVSGKRCATSRLRLLPIVKTIKRAAALTLVLGLGLGILGRPGSAQEAPRASISVARLTFAAPSSKAELPVRVEPQKALPSNSSLRVRGLPMYAALSAGYAVAPGIWDVPLIAAPHLSIIMPRQGQGRSDLVISLVKADGSVLAEARTVLVTTPAAATAPPNPGSSPLAIIRSQFDAFLARTGASARGKPTAEQKAETFYQFLTWPQNPLEVRVTVRLTSAIDVGETIGTIDVKNGEILIAGRKETALFLKPNLRGLRPGLYAFHIHETADCGPAPQGGQLVPGLAAGSHLWLSGTGALSGTTFTSHLGNLPHLEVDANETATKLVVAARLTIADVANRSIMIHASEDDFSARLACGPVN